MIKSKRGNRGLRDTAKEIGTSSPTLSRIENGNLPDIDTYLKICTWLDVPSDYFNKKATQKEWQLDFFDLALKRNQKFVSQ